MMNIKVSVVIPVYNAELYLRQLLDSLINQTLKEIEIICVDDGSTDDSLKILKDYEKADERIIILQQKNQFAGVARNNGLKIAKGEYVTFIDSDDFCELDGLEKLYKAAIENSLDFIKCASYCYNETTQQYEESEWYQNKNAEKIFNVITQFNDHREELYGVANVPWNGLYKISFLKENNILFPNFKCVNDKSFFVHCLVYAHRLMVTDCFFVHHRVNRSGSLVDTKHYHFDCQIKHYYRVKEILQQVNDEKILKFALRKELSSLIYWYKELGKRKINMFNQRNEMVRFCKNFNVDDVGDDYLKSFGYARLFAELENEELVELCKSEVENPKISVIIPVFNTVKYLPQCIESVLRQTLKEIEIICVDDGSSDGSYELLLEYADLVDKRIKVIRNQENGAAKARYYGCCMANSPYIQFLDSDDWLDVNALEEVYNESVKHGYDICNFKTYIYDDSISKITGISSGIDEQFLPTKQIFNYRDCRETILQINSTNLWSKCYRRDFIKDFLKISFGLKDSNDVCIAMYSSVIADKILFLPKPLIYHRIDRINSLQTNKDAYPLSFYKAYVRLFNIFEKLAFFRDIETSYVNRGLKGCVYALLSKKTEKGYYRTYRFLRRIGFKKLKLIGYSEHRYYNKKEYNIMKNIMNFDFILKKEDLLFLSNENISNENKERILDKYRFKKQLKNSCKAYNIESVYDYRVKSNQPCVSVIVPVYNSAIYLRSCLDSIKEQTLKNIEIICVNDGSTDDSLYILKRYAEEDNRFVVISQCNAGQSVARNTGVRFAKGKYLYFCDSDDSLKNYALEMLYENVLDKELDILLFNTDVSYQSKELENKHSSYIKYYKRRHNYDFVVTGFSLMREMLSNNEWFASPCLSMIKRSCFMNNELWFLPGIIHEDNFYTFKAMCVAKRAGYIEDKLYIRRIRANSTVTSVKRFANAYGYFICALNVLNYINNCSLFSEEIEVIKKILRRFTNNSRDVYFILPKEEQDVLFLLSAYEQIQFNNLILNYKSHQEGKANESKKGNIIIKNNSSKRNMDVISVNGNSELSQIDYELKKYKKELAAVKSGYSFRIGRIITYMPRKIRGGIRCYKEHGLKFTLKRLVQKIKNRL